MSALTKDKERPERAKPFEGFDVDFARELTRKALTLTQGDIYSIYGVIEEVTSKGGYWAGICLTDRLYRLRNEIIDLLTRKGFEATINEALENTLTATIRVSWKKKEIDNSTIKE